MLSAAAEEHPLVLLTGATGALGPRVVEALLRNGYRVRVLALDPPGAEALWSSVDVRIGDINSPKDMCSSVEGAHLVVHMAAMLHITDPSRDQVRLYELVNVDGTRNVVAAAREACVKRLVFFSTIAVYGDSAGCMLDEDALPRPDTPYARSKWKAEQIILEACLPDGRPLGTVLRLAAVYGSRVKGNYRRLVQALAKKRFIPIGPGTNRRTLVYDKDVAGAVLAVLTDPKAAGRIFNVTDGGIHTLNDIIHTICDALGRTPPRVQLPLAPLRSAAAVTGKAARLFGLGFPNVEAALVKLTEDLAVDGDRIRREIGFQPEYDLLTGLKETVGEMRVRGDI